MKDNTAVLIAGIISSILVTLLHIVYAAGIENKYGSYAVYLAALIIALLIVAIVATTLIKVFPERMLSDPCADVRIKNGH